MTDQKMIAQQTSPGIALVVTALVIVAFLLYVFVINRWHQAEQDTAIYAREVAIGQGCLLTEEQYSNTQVNLFLHGTVQRVHAPVKTDPNMFCTN